mmetsp:Transcript_103591/g.195040  ORF Transcript_103591/g.195040 Transcript_103591/m.195040 type:complete len:994 (+) Transcript_103591:151-3132(+)
MFSKKPQGKVAAKGPDTVEIDETLSPLDRARHFGTSKLSLQRLVFVHELVDCAHEIGYETTVAFLLPLVRQLASDPEVLVRQTLVGHFGDLAGFLIQSDPERGYQKVVDDLLPIISLLLAEKASEVRSGAADSLATLASHLRPGERGDQVLMTVISLSHSNDDEDARSTAVQLLNGLAETLGRDLCQQFVGVELIALCEDPAFRVRKATASNFAEVARVVGDDYVLKRLLPAFSTLVHDGHWGVRKAAAESLVGLAMAIKVEEREGPLVPLINALLRDTSRWVRMSALQQLGYFIAALENPQSVPAGLLSQYVEIIEQTKANPDAADISYHCAYTFAAVTRTMGTVRWPILQAAFGSLCRDTQLKTRKAMAASVHIVAQTLGPELTEQQVLPECETLLQDTSDEVKLAALKNVAGVLRVVQKMAPQKRVLKCMQGAVGKGEANWRLRHLMASQIGQICEAIGAPATPLDQEQKDQGEVPSHTQDLTWSVLVPLLLQLCGDGVAEVRDEAARCTARALRAAAPELFVDPSTSGQEGSSGCSSVRQPLPTQTTRLVRHLIRTFACGRSFRARQTYIRMCDSVIRESPPHVFTDLLLRPLVKIATDPVKNVRLCWAITLLPHLRRMGRLGQSHALVAAAARMAKVDSDPEVRRLISTAQLAELPEGWDTATTGPESDLDESDKGENWFGTEGGTGESSECSDVGVAEDDEDRWEAATGDSSAPAATGEATGDTSTSSASTQPPSVDTEASAATASPASVPQRSSPKMTSAPSPTSAGTSAPLHDAVEDSLVEQREIDLDADKTFADRRLFHEAEDAAGSDASAANAIKDLVWSALPPVEAAASTPAAAPSSPASAATAASDPAPEKAPVFNPPERKAGPASGAAEVDQVKEADNASAPAPAPAEASAERPEEVTNAAAPAPAEGGSETAAAGDSAASAATAPPPPPSQPEAATEEAPPPPASAEATGETASEDAQAEAAQATTSTPAESTQSSTEG